MDLYLKWVNLYIQNKWNKFKIREIIFKTMEIILKVNEHIFEINRIVIFFFMIILAIQYFI